MRVIIKVYDDSTDGSGERGLGVDLSHYPQNEHRFYLLSLFRATVSEVLGDEYRVDVIRRSPERLTGFGKLPREGGE